MDNSKRLETYDQLIQKGQENSNANYIYFGKIGDVASLRQYLNNKPIVCVAAGTSLDNHIKDLKETQRKYHIFCALQVYEKLLLAGITPEFVFSIETHPISDINDSLFGNWVDITSKYPPKIFITPAAVDQMIFHLPARNRFAYYLTSYKNNWVFAALNDNFILPGGVSVSVHMLQIALVSGGFPYLLGYDFCWKDDNYQRASMATGSINAQNVITTTNWFDETVRTNYDYQVAAANVISTLKESEDFIKRTTWCSPGLVPAIIPTYQNFTEICNKRFRHGKDVKPMPESLTPILREVKQRYG